jgi:hypothetical protein
VFQCLELAAADATQQLALLKTQLKTEELKQKRMLECTADLQG